VLIFDFTEDAGLIHNYAQIKQAGQSQKTMILGMIKVKVIFVQKWVYIFSSKKFIIN